MAAKVGFLVAALLSIVCFATADQNQVHVRHLKVYSQIFSRFATTLVTSKLANPTNDSQEIRFTATLPEEAFISNFSMQIGDKIIAGNVKDKQRAQQEYERAKSQGQSTGLVAQKARQTNSFTIYANVAAFDKVTFNLTYQEVLVRTHGAYRHVINVRADQLESTSDVEVRVEMFEHGKIVNVHVPRFSEKVSEKTNAELLKAEQETEAQQSTVELNGITTTKVYYRVKPAKYENGTLSSQLVVLYDVERDNSIGQIQVYDGYFVHFFAPKIDKTLNKRILFVLDKSGSMMGTKIQQTKQAIKRILSDLQSNDVFNIIIFDENVHVWSQELLSASKENVERATAFVDTISADGGTNIYDSLETALQLFNSSKKDGLVPMIILLTDGQPTNGKYLRGKDIIDGVTENNNDIGVIIHSIAFGYGADYTLMQGVSTRNRGLARKVYEDSDSDMQLTGFYAEISSPLLSELKIEYLNNTVDASSLVQENQQYYYDGGEVMILGKLAPQSSSDVVPVKAEVTATRADGPMMLDSEDRNVWICTYPPEMLVPYPPRPYPIPPRPTASPVADASTVAGFIERMWAFKTIKKLLKNSELQFNETEKDSTRQEVLRLSLKYRFVTEMTSMVVVQSDDEQNATETELGEDRGSSGRYDFDSAQYRGYSNMYNMRGSVHSSSGHFNVRTGIYGPPGLSSSFVCNAEILVVVVKSDNVTIAGEIEPVILHLLSSRLTASSRVTVLLVNEQLEPFHVHSRQSNFGQLENDIVYRLNITSDNVFPGGMSAVATPVLPMAEKLLIWISSTGPDTSSSLYNELTNARGFRYVTMSSSPVC